VIDQTRRRDDPPHARMVLIFVGGIPLALFVVIYDPALWSLSFNYGVLGHYCGGERLHAGVATARNSREGRHTGPVSIGEAALAVALTAADIAGPSDSS